MKQILLLEYNTFIIGINFVFGGKYPPKSVISPCECDQVFNHLIYSFA